MTRLWRSRLVTIAVREYLENVKTKAFLVAVLLTPLLMGMSFLIPMLLEGRKTEQRRIAIADTTGALAAGVAARLGAVGGEPAGAAPAGDAAAGGTKPAGAEATYAIETVPLVGADPEARAKDFETRREALKQRVLDGKLFAYVLLRPSALERKLGAPPSEYWTGNLIDHQVMEDVRGAVTDVANGQVVASAGVPKATADVLTTKAPMRPQDVRAQGSAGSIAATVLPFLFTLLLFLTIITVSQALITSTLEEKANRVIEVLLSSVSPFELMAGKILGTCAVGLTLMAIWASGGVLGLKLNGLDVVSGGQLGLCFVFYLLGFVLFASLMVAVGSACNTLKEAQNLLAPVMAVLTFSMFFLVAVGKDPHGTLSRVLSMIPIFTPFLMMTRIAATPPPPLWEIALSIALLAGSALLAMRFAARVFRVGVLMYGKPPTFRELGRWMRAK